MAFRESSAEFFWKQGFERRSVGTPVKPTAVGPLGPTGRGQTGARSNTPTKMAAHESPRTTKPYDRTKERLTQDEVERIRL
jgi:hypothetical protein